MIIPSGLSDLSANASSEAIMVTDHNPFHLEYKYNSESAPEGEIVLLHEAESLFPVDISPEDGEEFEGTSDPRSVKLKYRVYHLLVDLGWVDLGFECSTVCRILRGLTGIRQKRLGSWARWWNFLIKVNPTQVHEQMGHPVGCICSR